MVLKSGQPGDKKLGWELGETRRHSNFSAGIRLLRLRYRRKKPGRRAGKQGEIPAIQALKRKLVARQTHCRRGACQVLDAVQAVVCPTRRTRRNTDPIAGTGIGLVFAQLIQKGIGLSSGRTSLRGMKFLASWCRDSSLQQQFPHVGPVSTNSCVMSKLHASMPGLLS